MLVVDPPKSVPDDHGLISNDIALKVPYMCSPQVSEAPSFHFFVLLLLAVSQIFQILRFSIGGHGKVLFMQLSNDASRSSVFRCFSSHFAFTCVTKKFKL